MCEACSSVFGFRLQVPLTYMGSAVIWIPFEADHRIARNRNLEAVVNDDPHGFTERS